MESSIKKRSGTFNNAIGNYRSHSKIDANQYIIETENAKVYITVFSDNIIRVRAERSEESFSGFSYARIEDPKQVQFDVTESDSEIHISTSIITLKIKKNPLRLSFYTKEGQLINEDDASFGISWLGNEVSNYKKLQPDERFIGLGEKTGDLDRRGQAYVNWNTDNFAYAVDADPIYLSTPFYMGVHSGLAYGIFFDNSHKTTFSFGCSNDRFSYFQAEDGCMDYYFIYDDRVADIISHYTWLTGRMPLPAKWSLGFQQCRYSYYPYPEVLNAARTFREKHIPADVLYLDIHYMDAYKVFTWHPERFPDPAGLLKELKEMGFNIVVILDPGVKKENGYHAYDDGREKDLFVKYPDGVEYNGQVWPGWSAFPDFTKEEARKWWGEQMKVITETGVEGFWNDMNEPAAWGQHMPDLIEFHYEGEGGTHKKSRNVYGMQMARSTYEGSKNLLNGKRPFVLTRAGYCGIQRYAAVWTGDNVSTDEHMMAGIRLINSMGLTGVSNAGYDVGGFAGEASPMLFARWVALGAFSPFFRSHSMVNSRDSEPWSFGEEVEDISRNYIRLRYRLMPYIYSIFFESTQNGQPVARSLAIDYTHDGKIYEGDYQNQYFFGPAIMVAPIESYKEYARVYLPEGKWYDFFTDRMYEGKNELVHPVNKELLPLFVLAGSIVPMQSVVDSLMKEKPEDTMELHVYTGADGSFEYYEDDGESYAYQQGYFYRRMISYSEQNKQLKIQAKSGAYASHFKKARIYFHGIALKNGISLNGNALNVSHENYRFIEPISDFDPYHVPPKPPTELSNLPYVEVDWNDREILINIS